MLSRTLILAWGVLILALPCNAVAEIPTFTAIADYVPEEPQGKDEAAEDEAAEPAEPVDEPAPSEPFAYAEVTASAAALEAGYCGGGGIALQTRGMGLAVTDRDYVCARLAIARARLALAGALLAQGAHAGTFDTRLGAMWQEYGLEELTAAHEEIGLASLRLSEDDTRLRRHWVYILGSFPLLRYLAPR